MAAMSELVFQRLETLLHQRGVPFEVTPYAPVFTSQEAPQSRRDSLISKAESTWA
jgi:hypothetical protein